MSIKGVFRPKNPDKYKGDPTKIVYRSQWELHFMAWLDTHSAVEWWQSEEFHIPYFDPSRNKAGHYYPDFLVQFKDGKTILIEIKPFKETQLPIKGKDTRSEKRYLKECLTFAKNQAKWKHAHKYAEERGWQFKIMTENELGLSKVNRHH